MLHALFTQKQRNIQYFLAVTRDRSAGSLQIDERQREEILDALSVELANLAWQICEENATSTAALRAKAIATIEYTQDRRDDLAQCAARSLAQTVLAYLKSEPPLANHSDDQQSVVPGAYPAFKC